MERSKKYFSNHFSHDQLHTRHNPIQTQTPAHSPHFQRQNHTKSYSALNVADKENATLPLPHEQSFLNRYKKLDQFMDMQNYFKNLYGKKKQKRFKKQIERKLEKEKKQKLVLPSIYEKQNLQISFQQQLLKMKIESLQSRVNKAEQYAIDNNRLPPIMFPICQCQAMGHPQQFNQNYPQNVMPRTQKPGRQGSTVDKERRKRILRKFRICGIAMYFLTLFPHYSYLFGHFKLKQFLEKYLVSQNKVIRSINESLIEKFKQIPLYEQIRVIHDEYESEQKSSKKKTQQQQQDPRIKVSNDASNQTCIVNLGIFKRVVFMILKVLDQLVDSFDDQVYQFFGIGTLNSSYHADQTFAVEEMPFIHCHPDKNSLQVTRDQQRALLLSSFIIKKVVYQYLIRMAVDRDWHEELASFSSLKKKQAAFFKIVCKQIELAAFFFYELSIKNFYALIKTQQAGNFLQQSGTSMPLPLKTMRFPSLFMSQSQKQIFQDGFSVFQNIVDFDKKQKSKSAKKTNKNKSNGTVKTFDSKYSWNEQEDEIFEQYQMLVEQDPLNLIHNNFQFTQLSTVISGYMKSSYEKAQKSMMKIVDKLRLKVIQKRKKIYSAIRQKVTKTKNILTKQHQIQGVIFLRTNKQKKLVGITRRMLEIYIDVLAGGQVDGGEAMDLVTRRELISRKKTQLLSKKSSYQSMVSIVDGSVQSQTQSSSSEVNSKMRQ